MLSRHAPRRILCALVGVCALFLTACAALPGVGPATGTPTPNLFFATLTANVGAAHATQTAIVGGHGGIGAPPSVATFCPSPQTLAPIIGETMSPDVTTGTHGASTTCGYQGSTGDTCEFTITAWADAQTAQNDYNKLMNDAKQVGGQTLPLSGLGDAAFYWVGEDVTILKGSDDFFDKCYFLSRAPAVDEHVDVQIAQLLLARL
jgi:hypothetical protein